jgi:hypothetical protein
MKGLHTRVSFAGILNKQKVAEVLRTVDILILPTRIEGFGLAIIEAMMCGTVPVVSKLTGITDLIIDNGKTGILVERDDVKGFADAIVNLYKSYELLRSISSSAASMATKTFSLKAMITAYERMFAEEDDRRPVSKRNNLGWFLESLKEFLGKDSKRKRRLGSLLKTLPNMLGSSLSCKDAQDRIQYK